MIHRSSVIPNWDRRRREAPTPPTSLTRLHGGSRKVIFVDCYIAQMAPEKKGLGYVGYHGIGGGGPSLGGRLESSGLKIANYADTSGNPTAAKVYRREGYYFSAGY